MSSLNLTISSDSDSDDSLITVPEKASTPKCEEAEKKEEEETSFDLDGVDMDDDILDSSTQNRLGFTNPLVFYMFPLFIVLKCITCKVYFLSPVRYANKKFAPRFFVSDYCSCKSALQLCFYIPTKCTNGGFFTRSFKCVRTALSSISPKDFCVYTQAFEVYCAIKTVCSINSEEYKIISWKDDEKVSAKGKPNLLFGRKFLALDGMPSVKNSSLFAQLLSQSTSVSNWVKEKLAAQGGGLGCLPSLMANGMLETDSKTAKAAAVLSSATVSHVLDGHSKKREAESQLAKHAKRQALEMHAKVRVCTPANVEERKLDSRVDDLKKVLEKKRKEEATMEALLEQYREHRSNYVELLAEETAILDAMKSSSNIDKFPPL